MYKIFITLFMLFSLSSLSMAAEKLNVYYAGMSFIGAHADNKLAYRHSVSLSEELGEDGLPVLEKALASRMRQLERKDINLILDQLGDYRTGDAVSMAFAVDWENIAIEKIGDIYKVVVDLHAQVLLFDYSAKKVIGSYPVAIQIRDVSDTIPTDDELREIIKSLYIGNKYGVNIFDAFVNRVRDVPIKTSAGMYMRVQNVTLEDKALSHLPSNTLNERRAFQTLTAQTFGKFLSLNQSVSLLPYMKGEAIGSKMAMRFANGDVFNLTIPEADYGINLTVRGFKKVKAGENKSKVAWVYGSYVRIQVEQPEFGKVYMDIPFKNAAIKEVPVTQTEVDDWSAFQESLFSFFDQFSKQVSKPEKKWMKKATSEKDAITQMASFNKLLQKSR